MRAKGQLEVGGLVEVMLELALQRTVEVGLEEVGLHLDLADHAVLVGVEHAERVNEREVLRDLGELVVRDEAVPVVVVVLVHGLDHCEHVLLDGVGVEWGGEALRPGGEGRGARRRGGRAHRGARLAAQRELVHLVLRVAHVERELQQLDEVAVLLEGRRRVLQVGQRLEDGGELAHLPEVDQVVFEAVEVGGVQRDHVLQVDADDGYVEAVELGDCFAVVAVVVVGGEQLHEVVEGLRASWVGRLVSMEGG